MNEAKRTIKVEMLAFESPMPFRQVSIPDDPALEDVDTLLDEVFYWGQNDFQPQPCYSVSAGDVIHLPSGKWLVQSIGFFKLSKEQYQQYKALSEHERFLFRNRIKRRIIGIIQ